MLKKFFRLLFYLKGWKVEPFPAPEGTQRCVVIAAPHTSNWDGILSVAGFDILGIPLRWALKKEMFFFPLSIFLRGTGAISVDRSPKKPGEKRPSMVDAMAELFEENEKLALMIAPEGTRSYRESEKWKTGFYHIAVKAGVPIGFGYLDYKTKRAGIARVIEPSGDFEADMKIITDFYRDITPKNKENYFLDKDYV